MTILCKCDNCDEEKIIFDFVCDIKKEQFIFIEYIGTTSRRVKFWHNNLLQMQCHYCSACRKILSEQGDRIVVYIHKDDVFERMEFKYISAGININI